MLRNMRLLIAILCCLLIFSPMTEIWAKAEESTIMNPQEPATKAGSEEIANQEAKPGKCSEEGSPNPSNEPVVGVGGEPPASSKTESDPVNSSDAEPCKAEESENKLNPGVQGFARESIPFADIPLSYWAYTNIQHLSSLKVINGYENEDKTFSFRPEQKVTRAQAAKMIIEAVGEKQASVSQQIFKDIPSSHWAAGYIQRAYELGIFKGYEDGRFGPNDTLKRSHMAKVIVEAFRFDFNGYTSSTQVFYDVSSHYWAYDYIEKMHYNGMSNGSNYRFLPEELISRAQFSAFLSRSLEPSFRLKVTGPITTKGKVTSKTSLNIRSQATSSSTIIGSLIPGTIVNIVDFNGFWVKMNHNGISGFVHKSYLKLYSPDSNLPLNGRIIVLDPGHGQRDPGTNYEGYKEKDIVLSVSGKVADKLRAAGAKVVLTRDTDTFPSLETRVKLAQTVYAELFVSIHVNSVKNNTTANGTETYFNTSNNMNGTESRLLAFEIQKEIVEKAGMYNRGIKESGFYVIKNNQIPAVLVEMGFLPNPADREKLVSEQYQNIFAESIYQGIKNYYLK
jgi:N-acetylmuramoyl-L-alanine amidase